MRSTLSHIFLFLLHGKYAGVRTDEYTAQGKRSITSQIASE